MAANMYRRSYLASMEDLTDLETDSSGEHRIYAQSFGKLFSHVCVSSVFDIQ